MSEQSAVLSIEHKVNDLAQHAPGVTEENNWQSAVDPEHHPWEYLAHAVMTMRK